MSHKEWLDNEYSQWVTALQECTVDNFRDHPMVKRMLGHQNDWPVLRFIKYARMVLDAKPTSIIEIGGGCGQFYAILLAMGYKGEYFSYDLDPVIDFQDRYTKKAADILGVERYWFARGEFLSPFCISLYAYGEFDDETKMFYDDQVIAKCPHGLIVFNPHSGASDKLPDIKNMKVQPEYPLTAIGNKIITW